MATDGRAAGERRHDAIGARSHLFAVRLWREEVAEGPEYRGSVRDVVSGAFRNFREWSDLADFMVARIEEVEVERVDASEGARRGEGGDDP